MMDIKTIILVIALLVVISVAIYLGMKSENPTPTNIDKIETALAKQSLEASTPLSQVNGTSAAQEAQELGGFDMPSGTIYSDNSQMYPGLKQSLLRYTFGNNARPWYSAPGGLVAPMSG